MISRPHKPASPFPVISVRVTSEQVAVIAEPDVAGSPGVVTLSAA
jgi:hypothetical protein